MQTRQRIGDGVAAEHRPVVVRANQAAGHRGVVTEGHPVGVLALGAVTGDAQPHPTIARRDVMGAEPAPNQRRGAGRLDHHVGAGEQVLYLGRLVEIGGVGKLSGVHPVEEGGRAGPGAVGSGRALDLDDGGTGLHQQLPTQRAGPHRRQVDQEQIGQCVRRRCPPQRVYPRRGGGRLAEGRRREAEQPGAVGDSGCGPARGPVLHGAPRVGGRIGLHQRGDGVDVVGARQRDGAPAVAARQQPRRPARRDPAVRGQAQQRGPAGDDLAGVDGHAGASTEFVGHPLGVRHHGSRNTQRPHIAIVLANG